MSESVAFPRHRALRDLVDAAVGRYVRVVNGLVDYARAGLRKAGPDRIEPDDVESAWREIAAAHERVAQGALAQGIERAWAYGRLLAQVRTPEERAAVEALNGEALVQAASNLPQLTGPESRALDWAKHRAARHVRGLGNTVAEDFSTEAIEADPEQRAALEEAIREEVAGGVSGRATWRDVASRLGHRTTDWARDFRRIAATEKQSAMQEGLAGDIKKRNRRAKVAKLPSPDACENCLRLYTEDGTRPRVFLLAELLANGTNVGRKAVAWKPVVGATHPWCACELVEVPEGWGFDESGELVPPLNRAGWLVEDLRKARDRSYASLTYGDAVPDVGVSIRVGDPRVRAVVERVVSETPPEVFDRRVGVTLVTTDIPRPGNPLDDHDLAYWTGNEIRLSQVIDPERVDYCMRHEIGHSLNVWLVGTLGSVEAVRAWHRRLWAVSRAEGWVSDYARREPIENAAEVTRLYLYERRRLVLVWPRQFAVLHAAYRGIWEGKRPLRPVRGDLGAVNMEVGSLDADAVS